MIFEGISISRPSPSHATGLKPSTMGNSISSHRYHSGMYWALLFCLMLPPDVCQGWNIPFFSAKKTTTQTSHHESTITAAAAMGIAGAADKLENPILSPISEQLFGPLDAPHLRYIPSYFSNQIPDKIKQLFPRIASQLHQARIKIYTLLWYKPPVGIVSAWGLMRVMNKVYGIYIPPAPTSGEEALADAEGKLSGIIKSLMPGSSNFKPWGQIRDSNKVDEVSLTNLKAGLKYSRLQLRKKKRKKRYRDGRCFDLDGGDQLYNNFGGVETVRVRACQEGLRAAMTVSDEPLINKTQKTLFGSSRSEESDMNSSTEYAQDIEAALDALQLSCPPRSFREYFVEQSITALAKLQKYIIPDDKSGEAPSIRSQNTRLLLAHASKVIELRALDALLRTLRDRHLVVSSRLRRAQNYWKWHLSISSGRIGRFAQRVLSDIQSVLQWGDCDFRDRNQREYERITAAYERELLWLGKVEKVLLERPVGMEATELFSILGNCKEKAHWWRGMMFEGDNTEIKTARNLSNEVKFTSMINLLSKGKSRMWLRQTESWSKKARNVIAESLNSTICSSFTPIKNDNYQSANEKSGNDSDIIYIESEFLRRWASYDTDYSDVTSWSTVLSLIDFAASHQRAGERRHFQISGVAVQLKQYDYLAIPSTALMLAAANSLHDKVIGPHKEEIIHFVKSIVTAIWGIIEFRFYTPMKDIVLDLLNRRPRMVDPFALMNEQISLDNMLKDIGVGDGTREGRASALASASRMYEQEVAGGAIRGIIRGHVAQLMLIQIQQLKTDLLQGEILYYFITLTCTYINNASNINFISCITKQWIKLTIWWTPTD